MRNITSRSIQVVDDITYAQYLYNLLKKNSGDYSKLLGLINMRYNSGGHYKDIIEYVKGFYLKNDTLCHI